MTTELAKMLDFVKLPVDEDRLRCAKFHKDGFFERKKQYEQFIFMCVYYCLVYIALPLVNGFFNQINNIQCVIVKNMHGLLIGPTLRWPCHSPRT